VNNSTSNLNKRLAKRGIAYVEGKEEEGDSEYDDDDEIPDEDDGGDGEYDPKTAYVEDKGEEGDPEYEEEGEIPYEDDGSDGEYDPNMVDVEGIEDWEDDLMAHNNVDEEEDGDNPADSIDDSGQEYSISLSKEQEEAINKLQLLLACTPPATDNDILESFSNIIFQVFTSQPSDTVLNPYHAPIEAYLISRGIRKDGGFRSSLSMSNTFSKVQYAGLYTILLKCIKANKPLE
jgi:hypothetical protein